MTTVRGSYWLITINNPTAEDRDILKAPPDFVKQLWYQDEVGDNGTLHIQLCANTNQVRFSQMKVWLPRAHVEVARNSQACKNYCKKSDTSVKGTYMYYKQGCANEITEPAPPTLPTLLTDLLVLLNYLPLDPLWTSMDTPDIFEYAVYHCLVDKPAMLDKLTAPRARSAFLLAFPALLKISLEFAENFDWPENNEEDSQTDNFTECIISDI